MQTGSFLVLLPCVVSHYAELYHQNLTNVVAKPPHKRTWQTHIYNYREGFNYLNANEMW